MNNYQLQEHMTLEERQSIKDFASEFLSSPEGLEMCVAKFVEVQNEIAELAKAKRLALFDISQVAVTPDEYAITHDLTKRYFKEGLRFPRWPLSHAFKGEDELQREFNKWSRLIKIARKLPVAQGQQFDRDTLRQVPIQDLMSSAPVRDSQGQALYHCPFHEERTPSFRVYKNDNHFHCYGCQAHGDVISFVMKQDDCDFVTACKKLQTLI